MSLFPLSILSFAYNYFFGLALLANLFTIPQSTWFRKAAEGERYTSDIGIAPTGEPYQIMAIPGVGGEVIVARIRMMLLWNAISDLQFGDTGQAYIVDQTGRVIAHSDSDVVMAKTNLSGRPELIFPSVTETHRWIGPYTNFLGSRVVGTITRVRGFDWVVITEVAQSEARAITRRAGFVLGGGIALFGALALWIMSILFDRQLFRPIAALEAGTKRFSEGDLTYQIEMAQHDEIGHAAQMFNEMGARLHKRESELNTQAVTLSKEVVRRTAAEAALLRTNERLEELVQERTHELATVNTHLRKEIQERRRVEEILRESEEQFRLLFEHAPIGITVTSCDGKFLRVNQAFCDTVGYTMNELVNLTVADISHSEDQLKNSQLLDQALMGELSTFEMEKRYMHKNGQILDTILRVSLMRDAEEQPLYFIGQAIDITDHKRNEELIYQKQKTESLGILAGGVAHDFNNLLVGILGQTSLAMKKLMLGNSARDHIEKAVKAAEHASELTRQMLAYSGRGHFEKQPVNLNVLIQDNLHLFRATVPKHIQLNSTLADTLPLIWADLGQMQQIIMNLIINGAEAIGEQSGTLYVTTDVIEIEDNLTLGTYDPLPAGHYIRLSVSDNGCGMNNETLARLFDPFFSTKFTGRGLGMAAVLGILRGHQGGVQVESEVGIGSTFHLFFPDMQDGECVPKCVNAAVL